MQDSEDVSQLPAVLSGGVVVVRASSLWLTASLPGALVWWDGAGRGHVDLASSLRGQVRGLCGTFSGGRGAGDFTTPEGDVEDNPEDFANK